MLHTDLALTQDESYVSIVQQMAADFDFYEDMFQHSWNKLVYRDFGNKPCAEEEIKVPESITNFDEEFWGQVQADIAATYEEDTMDAPILVRLAWQCSGTFRQTDYRGGCDGGRIRFSPEKDWPSNKGLDKAFDMLQPVKDKHPDLSWADVIILAGTTALMDMGAPMISFCPGRTDVANEEEAAEGSKYLNNSFFDPETGRWNDDRPLVTQMHDRASMMGLSLREWVVLNGGGHSMGGCSAANSGYTGSWTDNPDIFDNQWFLKVLQAQDVLGELSPPWREEVHDGKTYVTDGSTILLKTDLAFTNDPEMRVIVEDYASDNIKFQSDFVKAWVKLVNSDRYGNVCLKITETPQPDPVDHECAESKESASTRIGLAAFFQSTDNLITLALVVGGFVLGGLMGLCQLSAKLEAKGLNLQYLAAP